MLKKTIISLLCFLGLNQAQAGIEIGQPAPEFNLVNQHGEVISLREKKGQWIVLYFYPKNDTPGCTTEACSFRDNINALIAQEAIVLGVSVDSTDSHKQFAQKYKLPFSLLSDPKGEVASKYGALLNLGFLKFAKRHSFIINPEGNIQKIYRNVDPDVHVKEVLAEIKRLKS
jgi:peroxiredoxin Q/BCP